MAGRVNEGQLANKLARLYLPGCLVSNKEPVIARREPVLESLHCWCLG